MTTSIATAAAAAADDDDDDVASISGAAEDSFASLTFSTGGGSGAKDVSCVESSERVAKGRANCQRKRGMKGQVIRN